MLRLSIVTVSYNMAPYIEQTILSVISQGYDNLEYIIVDGGSTDGTKEIVEKYRDRIACFISEPDNGMYDALNKGFSRATGDILAWINADDIYFPGAFRTVDKIFSTYSDIEWINGRSAYISEDGTLRHVASKNAIKSRKDILNGWCREDLLGYLMQEGMFWRRSLMERTGPLNTEYRYAGDFELWIRFAAESDLYHVNVPLSAFRKRLDNISSLNSDSYAEEVQRIVSGKKKYPGLVWRIFSHRGSMALHILRMLRIRSGNLICFAFDSGRIKRKRILGSASPHSCSSIKTLF